MTYCSELCVRVVSWGDFDNIRRCQVDTLETTNNRTDLASRPAASLWGSRSGSECRIDRVNVN